MGLKFNDENKKGKSIEDITKLLPVITSTFDSPTMSILLLNV